MIGVYMRPQGLTRELYEKMNERLEAAGVAPTGLKVHTCFAEGESLAIFDVWETKEDFEAFGAQLGPIGAELGVPPMEPMIVEMVGYQVG